MKVVVDEIPSDGLNWKSLEEGSSFLIKEEGLSFLSPVKVDVWLVKEKEKVSVKGRVDTELKLACSRCLEPCRHSLSTQLELTYYPLSSRVEGNGELKEDDLSLNYYREGIIDVRDDVREAILLSLPLQPLCRPECRGICPHCGHNLNNEECECREEQIDPRLAKLGKLLEAKELKNNG